jgi:hypothetical protein
MHVHDGQTHDISSGLERTKYNQLVPKKHTIRVLEMQEYFFFCRISLYHCTTNSTWKQKISCRITVITNVTTHRSKKLADTRSDPMSAIAYVNQLVNLFTKIQVERNRRTLELGRMILPCP